MSVRRLTVRLPPLGPRTRLYHLEPRGLGTPQVESLTGYVMRLAEAHRVTTSRLVTAEMLPLLRAQGESAVPGGLWALDAAPRYNGIGDLARAAVAVLGTLTGRQDLACLTLQPWAEVLSPYGLLRRSKLPRVWCPLCYADMLEQGRPLYEPLLWSVAAVTVCPQHGRPLQAHCPHDDCARVLPLLAATARPGHCSWCNRLLYRPHATRPAAPVGGHDRERDRWIAQQVGTVLALAPALPAIPTQASSIAALGAFVRARCGDGLGAYGRFARVVGVHANLLCAWRTGRARLTLALLLRVCQALGVSPAAFLLGDTSSLPTASPAPVRVAGRRPHRPPPACDVAQLRQEVATVLASAPSPPPSLAATARRLGCSSALLARLCPDACRVITDRYQASRAQQHDDRVRQLAADIREVMTQLDAAGVYPSARRVRAHLQHRVHPRNSDFHRIRHQVLQELGWNLGGTRVSHD